MPEGRDEVMPEPDGRLNLVGVSPHLCTEPLQTLAGRMTESLK